MLFKVKDKFKKTILSEIALYEGEVQMPKGFEVKKEPLIKDCAKSRLLKEKFPLSRERDKITTWITDHSRSKFNLVIQDHSLYGAMYKHGCSFPQRNIDVNETRTSPDFTCIYGIDVKDCWIKIYYDVNRRKGRSLDIKLETNHFIMFPSNLMYVVNNQQKEERINTVLYKNYDQI